MYVEIYQDSVWIRCDLGGYPSKITVSEDVSRLIESARAEESRDGISLTIPPQLELMETESSIQISKAFDAQQSQQESSVPFDSLPDYVSTLFTDASKKKRIDLPESLILQFQRTLQMQANQRNHPVFFVHGPDDLVCSNSYIAVSGDGVSGEIRPGPGGALHDFIIKYSGTYEGQCPIIVINYSAFSGEDLASWNHVLSNLRLTDSTKLPSNMILLGLFDPSKGLNYDPSDFDYRFDSIHQAPLHLLNREIYVLPKPITDDVLPSSRITINLGHSPRWKSQLLDHWILKNGKLWLAEGELSKARKTGQSIEILNPPEDEAFLRYWSLSNLQASEALNISFSEGYSWLWNKTRIQRTIAASPRAHIINPSQLVKFINPYKLVDGQLSQSSGIIADHSESTLYLYITRDLSEDEWVTFYKEYMKYPNIYLSFACAEAVACPPGLEDVRCVSTTSEVSCAPHHTQWILTNDMDLTLQSVSDTKTWEILDVSECLSADILTRMDCKDRALYLFAEEKGALLTALSSSKNIILMGDFSDSMIDDLAPFLIERLNAKLVLGSVLIISEKKFPYLTPVAQHQFGWEDKKRALIAQFSTGRLEYKTTAFQTLPYMKQCTALDYETHYPDRFYLRAWDGLMTLRSGIRLAPFDIITSLKEAKKFSISRKVQFEDAFSKWPYIVISGLTGVGKTTFIEHYFKKNLYQGSDINTLISWATYQAEESIVLFIDESNLLSRDWSEFEGLFHLQPNVLIDGKVYPLSVHHKVIFAGNPVSYSADRKMARLFDRHGCSVVFEPLSTAFIYEYIIKPIFADTPICLKAQSIIGETLLKVYQFIIETSEDSVLISPREVQMMALLVVQDIINDISQYNSKKSIGRISNYHAYNIGQNLVLTQHKSLFDLLFKPKEVIYPIKGMSETDFVYTESRLEVRHMLSNYLELRAHRQKSMTESVSMNDSQLYGGIGAFVIEGESSIGKKSLVGDVLNSFKLRLHHDYETIKPSKSFIEKKKILLDAFDKGRVVIMEEFNTAPMMEQLLNSLLMGKTPGGSRPSSPGFFVIGIQKSATMAGRTLPSNALARRIQTCHLPAYANTELDHILLKKGVVDAVIRETLIAVYNRKRLDARSNPLLMAPTFAQLMVVAEPYITKKRKLDLIYSDSKTKFFKSADSDDHEPESCERGMSVDFS